MINDDYIKSYFLNKRFIEDKLPVDIKLYIQSRFHDSDSLTESYIRIVHNIEERPVCPICDNRTIFHRRGYRNFYTSTCCNKNCIKLYKEKSVMQKYGVDYVFKLKEVLDKIKKTNIARYGTENAFSSPVIKEKIKQTNLERYGASNPALSNVIKEKIKQTNTERYGCEYGLSNKDIIEKRKETCLEKYGVDNVAKLESVLESKKHSNMVKYGVEFTSLLLSTIDKIKLSKDIHNSHTKSKQEDLVYEYLIEKYGVDNVIRQYKSEEYPFNCDFYICDKNLYIECNFHWTHGKHPFNDTDKNDILKLNIWIERSNSKEYYKSAIEVWTKRDPLKREYAIKSNLSYIELFTVNDIEKYKL